LNQGPVATFLLEIIMRWYLILTYPLPILLTISAGLLWHKFGHEIRSWF